MPNPVGSPLTYFQKAKFVVEIDSVKVGGFTTCSEYSLEFGMVEQREGGALGPVDVTPSTWKLEPVTLTRGMSNTSEIRDWAANQKAGNVDKRNVSVIMQDGLGNPLARVNYKLCSIKNLKLGDWDGKNENDNAIESVTFMPTDGDPDDNP